MATFYQTVWSHPRGSFTARDIFVVKDDQVRHLWGNAGHKGSLQAVKDYRANGQTSTGFWRTPYGVQVFDLQHPDNSQLREYVLAKLLIGYGVWTPDDLWGRTSYEEKDEETGHRDQYFPATVLEIAASPLVEADGVADHYIAHHVTRLVVGGMIVYGHVSGVGSDAFMVGVLKVREGLARGQSIEVSWSNGDHRYFKPRNPWGWNS